MSDFDLSDYLSEDTLEGIKDLPLNVKQLLLRDLCQLDRDAYHDGVTDTESLYIEEDEEV